jgi:hypothetical protein
MRDVIYSNSEFDCDDNRQSGLNYEQILLKGQAESVRWRELCARFLPIADDDSSWRYSHTPNSEGSQQGWKLHISATILNACEVLEKVAPFLNSSDIRFKAPASLQLLSKLNSGISFGYSQVGKFITVYPQNTDEAIWLADKLHKLTLGDIAPSVPFDSQYCPNSCVYYRYGAFKYIETETANGVKVPAIRDLSGNLIPDLREQAVPAWLEDPFQPTRNFKNPFEENYENPLKTKYNIFRALKQRGKGGVYQAIDITQNPPRLCAIKEGRRYGEVGWDGSDGFSFVKYEAEVLSALESTNVAAPRFYSTFEVNQNFYLAFEFIEGKSLQKLMLTRRRRFSVRQVLKFACQIAELLARLHRAGWIWRDCKPGNLIVTKNSELRPLDFEGACRTNQPNIFGWRTIEFSAPQDKEFPHNRATEAEDVYSLGAVIYFLLTGKIYEPDNPQPVSKLRRNVPSDVVEILEKLLVLPIKRKRPSAEFAVCEFEKLMKNI